MRNDGYSPRGVTGIMLGRYHLLQRIGRGRAGEVWLAEDAQWQRQVAIKTVSMHNQDNSASLQRFAREVQAAAALHHPHILPIYDFGEQKVASGQSIAYIVMPYVPGGSLAERIEMLARGYAAMSAGEAMSYLAQAAEALDYAHAQGVLHRAIQPGNLLLRSDNRLLLTDFGIACIFSDQERSLQAGLSCGTAEYMAPEQVQGRAEAASDIYSLAVIAYQLSTGQVPFKADTPYATTMQHMIAPPPSPRQFNPSISPAVEQALLYGLAKEPAQRPPSARAFVAALQKALAANMAFEAGGTQQPFPQARAMTDSFFYAQNLSLANERQYGDTPLVQNADQPTGITRRQILIGGGAALLAIGGLGAWAIAASQNHASNQGQIAAGNSAFVTLTAHSRPVSSLAWSPLENVLATASDDHQVLLWDMQKFQQRQGDSAAYVAKQHFPGGLSMLLVWSADGKSLAIGNIASDINRQANSLTVYTSDLHSTAPGFDTPLEIPGNISMQALSWALGKYLVTITTPIVLQTRFQFRMGFWDSTQPQQATKPIEQPGQVELSPSITLNPLAASRDGSLLAIGTNNGVIVGGPYVTAGAAGWKFQPLLLQLDIAGDGVDGVTWSPDGRYVAGISNAVSPSKLAVWDWKSRSQNPYPLSFPSATKDLTTLAWSPAPGSRMLAAGGKDGTVYVWKFDTGTGTRQPVQTLNGPKNALVRALAWSMDGQWLAAGYNDRMNSILIWKM